MLGDNEGKLLGAADGEPDGVVVGSSVGLLLGDGDGSTLGATLGNPVGSAPGVLVGTILGASEGKSLDSTEGSTLCLLYTSPSPRDRTRSRMPSSA